MKPRKRAAAAANGQRDAEAATFTGAHKTIATPGERLDEGGHLASSSQH